MSLRTPSMLFPSQSVKNVLTEYFFLIPWPRAPIVQLFSLDHYFLLLQIVGVLHGLLRTLFEHNVTYWLNGLLLSVVTDLTGLLLLLTWKSEIHRTLQNSGKITSAAAMPNDTSVYSFM